MALGRIQFGVIPWTRVAAATSRDEDLVLVCGSGAEEAALVLRSGISFDDVQTVAVPQEGGIKDLTAAALMRSLGLEQRTKLRMPSGDGAILALVGRGADAAVMVEPYATMVEELGVGTVFRRTSDVWPGAPGCSLTTTRRLLDRNPDLVRGMVAGFVEGALFVEEQPSEAAVVAERYIGIGRDLNEKALERNRPSVHALSNTTSMDAILNLMLELGLIEQYPSDYKDLTHLQALDAIAAGV